VSRKSPLGSRLCRPQAHELGALALGLLRLACPHKQGPHATRKLQEDTAWTFLQSSNLLMGDPAPTPDKTITTFLAALAHGCCRSACSLEQGSIQTCPANALFNSKFWGAPKCRILAHLGVHPRREWVRTSEQSGGECMHTLVCSSSTSSGGTHPTSECCASCAAFSACCTRPFKMRMCCCRAEMLCSD